MKKLILDTSVFVNPASGQSFGHSPTSSFCNFLEMAQKTSDLEFFMPPSIYYELSHFAEEAKIPVRLKNVVQQQAPKKNELKVPGIFIYNLVDTMRDRVDRGLRLAERHVREALVAPQPKSPETLAKGDASKKHGEVRADAEAIGRLRETYRRIMREGALDSKADVDLLLLTYELDGILVTADEGVLLWAEHLGLKILPYPQLKSLLEESSASSKK